MRAPVCYLCAPFAITAGLDNHKDGENGAVHNAGEDCEEDDDNDSEPPPSMRDSSGSEGEMDDYPSTRVNIRSAAGKWSKSMPYSPKFRTPDPVKQVKFWKSQWNDEYRPRRIFSAESIGPELNKVWSAVEISTQL